MTKEQTKTKRCPKSIEIRPGIWDCGLKDTDEYCSPQQWKCDYNDKGQDDQYSEDYMDVYAEPPRSK